MPLDPRTPVLVGAGQVVSRPDPSTPLPDRPDPVALMASALRAAAEDCTGAAPGGPAGAGDRLLRRTDSLGVVGMLSWRAVNPGLLVARELGIDPAEQLLTAIGGNMPQALLHRSAAAIARGERDVVLVTGAECGYTRAAARKEPGGGSLGWPAQDPSSTPAPTPFGTDRTPVTELEAARGIQLPIHAYPLLENALRGDRGWSIEEHRRRIGRLWSGFSEVAATNPNAWLPTARTPEEIVQPGPANRMVAFPYPKLCTANLQVDLGAAYICCSVEAARAAGVPEDRWVFPLAGAEANDHWYLSDRPELHRSPAIRAAGRRALELAGVGIDDVGPVDLYSCFPCVVRIAAAELGLDAEDPARPLTLTGGLTFAGGPGNNYTSHGIAAMVDALRRSPGAVGLVTGLGWYATKHAVGLYSTRPPQGPGGPGFRADNVQEEVDRLPTCPVDAQATGAVTVETYTVTYDRDGAPERAIVACRTAAGNRTWANVIDRGELAELTDREGIGRTGTLAEGGVLSLG